MGGRLTPVPAPPRTVFPELVGRCLIRELHVYGQLVLVGESGKQSQHTGLGKRMMRHAEGVGRAHGYAGVAVISGVGVRRYYQGLGYRLHPGEGGFMVKDLARPRRRVLLLLGLACTVMGGLVLARAGGKCRG